MGSCFVRRIELVRTTPFRLTLTFAVVLIAYTLVTCGLLYWQVARVETDRIRTEIALEVSEAAKLPMDDLLPGISLRLLADLHRASYAALFAEDGEVLAGNLAALPPDLPIDGTAHRIAVRRTDGDAPGLRQGVLAAHVRPDGSVVVIGRAMEEIDALGGVVRRALALGALPSVLVALGFGALISFRALRRVRTIQQTIGRIMRGNLHERLPTRGTTDDLDSLAVRVNLMLDQIVHLLDEVKSVGDNIAHDLRTPLSVVRAKLERGLAAAEPEALRRTVGAALVDLDKAFVLITALLRIAEIESSRRRTGFGTVDLGAVVAEAFELYEPLAEARSIAFTLSLEQPFEVMGDRDLLMEAVANLIDNAIKFTPEGGMVRISLTSERQMPVIRVADSGPGIPPDEREEVSKRFYRADKSRHIDGYGLGLSLVAAIVNLHGFRLRIGDNAPGATFDLICDNREPGDGPAG
ncbi:MAG: two-component sensor histidine kinase [Rhodospirillales bacterium]|nr:two-component sensor histidine kinase [Rhodospirillales bacterium]